MSKIKSTLLVLLSLPFVLTACSSENSTSQSSDSSTSTSQEEGLSQPCFYDGQGLAFYPKDDGTYAVHIGHAGLLNKIVIPDTFNGHSVTEIKSEFCLCVNDIALFKSITIPTSITKIGSYAFAFGPHDHFGEKYCLEEFKYLGSVEQFSKINFKNYWYSNYSDPNQDLKFSFADKEFKFSEAYDSLGLSINYKKYINGDTYNVYLGATGTPQISSYYNSSYSFFETIQNNELTKFSSDTSIVSHSLQAQAIGEATYVVTDGKLTMTLIIHSRALQSFSDDVFKENEIFDFDGRPHSPVKPIRNLPNDVYVYYDASSYSCSYQDMERNYNRNESSHPVVESQIGEHRGNAFLFKPGYEVKVIPYMFIINNKEKNDYVKNMSVGNHLYIHFLPATLDYNDYYVCASNGNAATSVRFDWIGIGTYGGAYVDIDLTTTHDGGWDDSTKTYGGNEVTFIFPINIYIYNKTTYSCLFHIVVYQFDYCLMLSNGEKVWHEFFYGDSLYGGQITSYPVA